MIRRPSPNYNVRGSHHVSMVVIHGTGTMSDEAALSWLVNPASKVSYHYLIANDGTLYELVPEKFRAWHAGKSAWQGREIGGSVNAISLGIALTGDGSEPYTPMQYDTLATLLSRVMMTYRIPPNDVRGHNEVSPGRKADPYTTFDWQRVLGMVGDR